jgi:hypothetical protein
MNVGEVGESEHGLAAVIRWGHQFVIARLDRAIQ